MKIVEFILNRTTRRWFMSRKRHDAELHFAHENHLKNHLDVTSSLKKMISNLEQENARVVKQNVRLVAELNSKNEILKIYEHTFADLERIVKTNNHQENK